MSDLARAVLEMVPDLAAIEDEVRDQVRAQRGVVDPRALVGPLADGVDLAAALARGAALVAAARRAADRIAKAGADAVLDEAERMGAEAIVALLGRPALLVQEGMFAPPPAAWRVLESHRARIEAALPAVGRVEIAGDDGRPCGVGTGFLAGPGVLMTNRHVAELFCAAGGDGVWRMRPEARGQVDFLEEHRGPRSHEFALTDVAGVHPRHDLALLRVAPASRAGRPLPAHLTVAASGGEMRAGRPVYVVGYPAYDERNPVAEMLILFSGVFEVKRLQPGKVVRVEERAGQLVHDASTLGGNSGSCVVDLETHRVVGLHAGGLAAVGNSAVALWRLRGDPLLRRAGVAFAA
jgi:hypothetical protein